MASNWKCALSFGLSTEAGCQIRCEIRHRHRPRRRLPELARAQLELFRARKRFPDREERVLRLRGYENDSNVNLALRRRNGRQLLMARIGQVGYDDEKPCALLPALGDPLQ